MNKLKFTKHLIILLIKLTILNFNAWAQCPTGISGGPTGFGSVICSPSPTYNLSGGEPNSTWTIKQNGNIVATSTGPTYTLSSISGNNIVVEVELTTPGCSQQTIGFNVKSASFTVIYGTGWYDVEFTENNASVTWSGPGIDWNDAGNSNVFYGICNSGTGTVTMTTSDGCTASQTISYTGVDAAVSGPSSVQCGTSATYVGSQNGGTGTFSVSPSNAGSFSGSTFTADANYSGAATITYTVDYNYSTPKSGTNNMTCTATKNIDITCCTPTSNTANETACDSYTWSANGMTYTSSGTYSYTTTGGNGCPHTEVLNLTINTSTSNTTNETACDSYTWSANGMTYTSSGTYSYTTTGGNGCPHTELLNLTINTGTSNTTNQTACDSYTWSANGMTYTNSGSYSYTTTGGSGCPHTEVLSLTINTSTSNTANETACDSYTWSANGMTYTSSGTYSYTTTGGNGCPHTEVLNLTINSSTSNTTNETACDSYTWSANGMTYTSSGTYSYTTTGGNGCPHTEVLNLTINSSTSNTTNQTACDSYTWSANGMTYTSSGTYSYTTTGGNGCPHTEVLYLTINTSTINTSNQTACDSYTWSANGMTYTSSGTYSYTTTGGNGCPHTEVLNLTINSSTSNTTNETACDSYTWSANGMTYTSSGTYSYTNTGGNGCPHTEVLNLTINVSNGSTTNLTLCTSALPYFWNGQSITTAGTYSYVTTNIYGCDSTAILVLTISTISTSTTNLAICVSDVPYMWNGQSLTSSGTYTYQTTSSSGCDSIATLNLNVYKSYLGNYVWNDVNKDGLQNLSELGVSGVTVSLLNALNNEILSTVITDAYGYYRFGPICAGSYKVQFSLPSNYVFTGQNAPNDAIDSDPNVFTGITDTYVLAPGDSTMTVDAGIYQPLPITATVGDRVWFDANSNGLQDVGESGVSGITVSLYNCTNPGVPVATTITDAGGNYLFENVIPGNYQVSFSVPLGMLITTQSGVIADANNSDVNPLTERTACFTVNGGDNITFVDAGLVPKSATTSSLGDRVWNDANQDGIQDANETGVQGVLVTLYAQDGTTVVTNTTTDGLGNYAFNGIAAGCYVIGFSNLPSGYIFSPSNAGADTSKNSDANTGTGKTSIVCIGAGQNNPTIDAGIYNNANTNSIGDRVWYDVDKDGIQDVTEYGYPGVVVTLYDCSNNSVVATTTTNADGAYLFSGLANGSYYVGFGFIQNFRFSAANADLSGINGANNSDANPSSGLTDCVSLTGNTHLTSIDAGVYPGNGRTATSSLGDRVWVDVNNNGLQDNGEPGVPNVKVTLYEADGTTVLDTTSTDGLGNYIFTDLLDGEFIIGFDVTSLPSGYIFTTQGSNLDDESNSDANTVTGKTSVIILGLGEDKLFVDAGIIAPVGTVCLGDYVWIDLDNDGVQEANEPGVPGITVKLYDGNSNTVLQVATTSEEGNYMFCGLTQGTSYSVGFENLPNGFSFTTQNGALGVADNSDANPTTGRTTTVTLGSSNDLTLDAGIYSSTTAVVGNYVWYDEDADGIQDATEAPIPGVLVTMYDNTNTPVASAITNSAGLYLFTNVAPGTYTIGFEGYSHSLIPTTKGTDPLSDIDNNVTSTSRTDAFTVTAGSSNLTLDAGFRARPIAGLGNYVWQDLNVNGLQDASEPGIPGVIVTLYASDGVTAVATAITDGDGAYSFPNLDAGGYIVGFSNIPSGLSKTIDVGTLNDPLNSDIDALNKTGLISLAEGTYNPNIDAGFIVQTTLPTQWSHFGANIKGCATILYWATANEAHTSYIDIERKDQVGVFTKVGRVQAKGTSNTTTDYSYSDAVDESGSYVYRLKMVDIDGRFGYSAEKAVNLDCSVNEIVLYPNPTNSNTSVLLNGKEKGEIYVINVLDMRGAKVYSTAIEITSQSELVNLPLENLSAGIYSVQVTNGSDKVVFKVNKQ